MSDDVEKCVLLITKQIFNNQKVRTFQPLTFKCTLFEMRRLDSIQDSKLTFCRI